MNHSSRQVELVFVYLGEDLSLSSIRRRKCVHTNRGKVAGIYIKYDKFISAGE
jgi:hypothetical protein